MSKVEKMRWTVQIPKDVDDYLAASAEENCTSKNAELIRAVRQTAKREAEQNADT